MHKKCFVGKIKDELTKKNKFCKIFFINYEVIHS